MPAAAVLRALLEAGDDAICTVDAEYRYTGFNARHAAVVRAAYGSEVALGRNALDVLTVEADRVAARIDLDRALRGAPVARTALTGGDGRERRSFEVRCQPLRDAGGVVVGVVVRARDVTQLERALTELRIQSLAIESSANAIALADLDGLLTYVNPAFLELWGYDDASEVLGRPLKEFAESPEDIAALRDRLQGSGGWAGELTARPKRGAPFVAQLSASTVLDDDGAAIGVLVSLVDVTARRHAEEASRASEVKFATAFQCSPDVVVISRVEDGRITDVNESFTRITGFSREEALRSGTAELGLWAEPGDRTRVISDLMRDGTVRDVELPFRARSGKSLTGLYSGSIIDLEGARHILSVVRDITARHAAEAQVRESESRLRGILDNLQDAYFRADSAGRLLFVSRSAADMFGYASGEEMIGLSAEALYSHPGLRDALNDQIGRHGRANDFVAEGLRKDGGTFWVSLNVRPYFDEDGRALGTEGLVRDITERRMAEDALHESQERYRAIFCESPIAVELFDAAGILVDVNPACLSLFGVGDPGELTGADLFADPALAEEHKETLRRGEIVSYEGSLDFGAVRDLGLFTTSKTGTIWLDVLVTPLGKADLGYLVQVQDITERRRAEVAVEEGAARLRATLHDTVRVLGEIVGLRDPYTAWHERGVTRLADAIALELGLDDETREGLMLAGQVHDIGKIAVPAEILSKPAALTEMERRLVEQHAPAGREILSGIAFHLPVADIVGQHHERLDGSGYPDGLSGEAIRLEARIMAVADVVEAMTSHRPYRASLGTDAALAEVRDGAGSRYDADVVAACERVIAAGFAFEVAEEDELQDR